MLRSLAAAVAAIAVLLPVGTTLAQKAASLTIGNVKLDFADPAFATATEAQKRFLADYRAARASGDPAVMRGLVHRASTACMITPTAQEYFASRMQDEVRAKLPATAAVIFVPTPTGSDLLQGFPGLPPALAALPVTPAQILAIDYSNDVFDDKGVLIRKTGATIIRQLALDGGALRLVEYCLTPKGEEWYAKKAAQSRAAPK